MFVRRSFEHFLVRLVVHCVMQLLYILVQVVVRDIVLVTQHRLAASDSSLGPSSPDSFFSSPPGCLQSPNESCIDAGESRYADGGNNHNYEDDSDREVEERDDLGCDTNWPVVE